MTNTVLMQEYSYYSVIAPESCAAILWSDSSLAERAAEKLRMSPPELQKLGVIDGIIPEPKGGAHRDWNLAAEFMKKALIEHMEPHDQNGQALVQETHDRPDRKVPRHGRGGARARADFLRSVNEDISWS